MKRFRCYPMFVPGIPFLGAAMLGVLLPCLYFSFSSTFAENVFFLSFFSAMIAGSLCMSLWFFQWVRITDGEIVLRNLFCVMERIVLEEATMEVRDLWAFACRTKVQHRWICVYANPEIPKFREGCCNRVRKGRIQLLYSKPALEAIKKGRPFWSQESWFPD